MPVIRRRRHRAWVHTRRLGLDALEKAKKDGKTLEDVIRDVRAANERAKATARKQDAKWRDTDPGVLLRRIDRLEKFAIPRIKKLEAALKAKK